MEEKALKPPSYEEFAILEHNSTETGGQDIFHSKIFERFRQNYAKTAMKSFRLMFNEKLRFQVPRGTWRSRRESDALDVGKSLWS